MRGTYRCTNVKFCMEDENQRRAWEYLHGLSRRDGSYGKILSDALVAVIDAQNEAGKTADGESVNELKVDDALMTFSNEIAGLVLEGIKEMFMEQDVFPITQQVVQQIEGPDPQQVDNLAEDMLDFAFAMGE